LHYLAGIHNGCSVQGDIRRLLQAVEGGKRVATTGQSHCKKKRRWRAGY